LKVPAHPIVWNARPLETGDELARQHVQVFEDLGKRRARRLLDAQNLDANAIDVQPVTVAFHGAVRNEVIQVGVVLQRRAVYDMRAVIEEPPEESERVGLR